MESLDDGQITRMKSTISKTKVYLVVVFGLAIIGSIFGIAFGNVVGGMLVLLLNIGYLITLFARHSFLKISGIWTMIFTSCVGCWFIISGNFSYTAYGNALYGPLSMDALSSVSNLVLLFCILMNINNFIVYWMHCSTSRDLEYLMIQVPSYYVQDTLKIGESIVHDV